MRLEGKIAIVTGAGSGFGAEIARRFAAEGARVMAVDLNAEAAAEVAASYGGPSFSANVGDGPAMEEMFARTAADLGPVDILVNNAGTTHLPKPMHDVTEEEFDRVFNVNCKSVYWGAKYLVPAMKARGTGAIVNIASTAGVSPRPNLNWYNSSKGWMITATRAMAVELAPFGIRVNAVNPVAGETPLLKSFMGQDTPEVRAKFLSTIPLGRFSTPADIANATLYLASDEASMVTGVCMEVDGGRCI
ncbi:glucose 1-dehydrogenase [Pseudooceanicola sp. 216_PA32_1]|uniref:Glucose 1-dehydrogenase n=1 Tax=Pseudooceanicola pacificus TaxID=2676438 RepID=A0A844W708_9RHOB|nr:glucose 1-dehydrogenase [Pseudooceanicola pacificus]MWB76493.1 glucose 1-dehydrogenase [Pseudooceanicola pacificus]